MVGTPGTGNRVLIDTGIGNFEGAIAGMQRSKGSGIRRYVSF